jgi:hypothetical protein
MQPQPTASKLASMLLLALILGCLSAPACASKSLSGTLGATDVSHNSDLALSDPVTAGSADAGQPSQRLARLGDESAGSMQQPKDPQQQQPPCQQTATGSSTQQGGTSHNLAGATTACHTSNLISSVQSPQQGAGQEATATTTSSHSMGARWQRLAPLLRSLQQLRQLPGGVLTSLPR